MGKKMNEDFNMLLDIPQELENLQLPSPLLLQYYNDRKDRIIYIDTDIDVNLIEISKLILMWNNADKQIPAEQRKPIKLIIYTYGGDSDACRSFYQVCLASKTPVYTYNFGVAASAGAIILLAGHKRYAMENSLCLIHEGSASFKGTASETKEFQKNYELDLEIMKQFILSRTTISASVYGKMKEKDWYIRGEDQIKYGIVEKMITSLDEILD